MKFFLLLMNLKMMIFRLIKDNSFIDYYDNDEGDDSLTNFKFKTDNNLVYNKKLMFLFS